MLIGKWLLAAGVAIGTTFAVAGVSVAGDGNVLYLLQAPAPLSAGELFVSDQSTSTNSSIGTELRPAKQMGYGDTADIKIDSQCLVVSIACGHADLLQGDDYQAALAAYPSAAALVGTYLSGLGTSFGSNTVQLSVTGHGTGTVSQYGLGNHASLSINGASAFDDAADGAISQVGLGNQATLNVALSSPGAANVSLNQYGLNNVAALNVTAAAGQTISYTQIGAGLSHGTPASPVTIWTTGSVSITQTNFGTFGY